MTREEIISQGAPIEPNCFETDREEQWYKVGLYEGATASQWHDVSQGDLPLKDGRYLTRAKNGFICLMTYSKSGNYWSTIGYQSDVKHWAEIPQKPKKGGEK